MSAARRVPDALVHEAALLSLAWRLALWALPWRAVHTAAWGLTELLPLSQRRPRPQGARAAEVGAAFSQVPRFVPRATCLVQALSAHLMLVRRNLHSALHLGVKRAAEAPFGAHAWVESDGEAVVGGDGSGFVRMEPLVRT